MYNYQERTKHLTFPLILRDYHLPLYRELTRPEKFKGDINELKIEYFDVEIVFGDDGKISFKEKQLKKGYMNPIHRIIKYANGKKVRDYTLNEGKDFIFLNYFYEYDNEFNLKKIINQSSPNDKLNHEEYSFEYANIMSFTKLGQVIKRTQLISKTYRESQGGFSISGGYKDTYKFNKDGLLINELWERFLWTYKYDINKRLIEKIGQVANESKTKIESEGRIDSYFIEPTFFSDHEILYKETFNYYENGKFKRIVRNNVELESIGIKEANLIKEFNYDDDGNKIIIESSTINEDNSKTIYNKNGEILSFEKTTYFRTGVKSGEDKFKWTYEYDKLKNWIYCVQYVNNKPTLITRRTFDY